MKRFLDLSATLAGAGFLFLALLTATEVIMRNVVGTSFTGVDEIGGYIYAIGAAIGFVVAFADNAHIRIDLILKRLPLGARFTLNLLSHVVLLSFAALLAWRAGAEWLRSWELGALAPTPLRTPLIWPQGLWLLCLAAFAVMVGVKTVRGTAMLFSQGVQKANTYLDIDSNAELESEISSFEDRAQQENKK